MKADEQRKRYEETMGAEAMQRQVVARERARGCTCSERLILSNRTRGANAGHDIHCPLTAEANFTH